MRDNHMTRVHLLARMMKLAHKQSLIAEIDKNKIGNKINDIRNAISSLDNDIENEELVLTKMISELRDKDRFASGLNEEDHAPEDYFEVYDFSEFYIANRRRHAALMKEMQEVEIRFAEIINRILALYREKKQYETLLDKYNQEIDAKKHDSDYREINVCNLSRYDRVDDVNDDTPCDDDK